MSKLLPLCAVVCVGLRRLVAYHDESMFFHDRKVNGNLI